MSVFEPLLKERGKFLEKSTKIVKARDILDAIQKHENPAEIVSVIRKTRIYDTPFHNYELKLERVV